MDNHYTSTEELQYERNRLKEVNSDSTVDAYPHEFPISLTIENYIRKYNNINAGIRNRNLIECVA